MKTPIAETARVLETRGETALVRLEGGRTCRKCGLAAIGLCKPGGTGMEVRVENRAGASPGDSVRLALKRGAHWRGYFLAYLLPLASFVAGAFAGDALSAAAGVTGLDVVSAFSFYGLTLMYSLRKMRALEGAERMYISRVVRDVPDFHWQDASGAEAVDYLQAFKDAGP
jgi:positive regulator of sigma E activity